MSRLTPLLAVSALALALAGCSGAPAPLPSGSSGAIDHTEQSTIDGEWTLTRTVTATDDVNNPAHAVGTVSVRSLLFGDIICDGGPCSGGVLSGPSQSIRDSSTFTSSGNTITYEFTGFLNCIRQDTGAVLVADGYSYTAHVELKTIATDAKDDSKASTLEGTMTYTDSITAKAIEAGCSRDPVTATTSFDLSALRTTVAIPDPNATSTPAPN